MTDLATTREPQLLVPGSLEALHADADALDAHAATLTDVADDVGRHVVASWIGDAAAGWAPRRAALSDAVLGVADVFTFAASVLRAHADVLTWGRERAAVAADMWINVPGLSATGGLIHYGSDTSGVPGMLSPHQVFGGRLGDPFDLRVLAEAVLADARREVAASEEAAAQVLDTLCEGMPDGRWDPGALVSSIGGWLASKAMTLPAVLATRAVVDHDGLVEEGKADNEALGALGEMAVHNPEQVVPILLDTQTLEDNPAAWWGTAAPEIALSAIGLRGALGWRRIETVTAPPSASAPASASTLPAVPQPRVFTSTDEYVGELATALDAHRPGWVGRVNFDVPMGAGTQTREIDIEVGDVWIQVKSGEARRIISQMNATVATTGHQVVGYAPTIRPGALAEAARQGLLIARTPEELIEMLEGLQ